MPHMSSISWTYFFFKSLVITNLFMILMSMKYYKNKYFLINYMKNWEFLMFKI